MDIEKRLEVYRGRLQNAHDEYWINFYTREIEEMENELEAESALYDLQEEMGLVKPWTVKTDSWETVREVFENCRVVLFDQKWSWRRMKFMFYMEYYHKK